MLRRYAVASAGALVAAGVYVHLTLSEAARDEILAAAGADNRDTARILINHFQADAAAVLAHAGVHSWSNRARLLALDAKLRAFFAGTRVVKIKLIAPDGTIAYSSDLRQVGLSRADSAGFIAAMGGRPYTEHYSRSALLAYNSDIADRIVIGTFLPISGTGGARPMGVVEVFHDGTDLFAGLEEEARQILVAIVTTLTIVYVVLYGVVWKVESRLRREVAHTRASERTVAEQNVRLQAEIGERERAVTAAVAAREAALSASAAKSQFLATMSHELRTPLNAIIGFSEMMNAAVLGPIANQRYAEYVRDIHKSGRHLLSLVSDVLEMSRIESGKYALDLKSVALTESFDDMRSIIAGRVEEAGQALRVEAPPGLCVTADSRALRQILLNLVGNAVKFTPKGGEIVVTGAQRDDGSVSVSVADSGIGIAPDKLARVFDPFFQVEPAEARKFGGVGLGLAICKSLVDLLGGRIDIKSRPEKGTVVTLTLTASGGAALRI